MNRLATILDAEDIEVNVSRENTLAWYVHAAVMWGFKKEGWL